jgi:hypothetical protein
MQAPVEPSPESRHDLGARLQAALSDRYRIVREVGRGGMGMVFLGDDPRHGRQVAIKVLHPDIALALGTRRFLDEIVLAAGLEHPYIVKVHESGEADGLFYYVMPYVEGESLRERLERDGPLPVEAALRVAIDVAEALGCAHAHRVVHRDIKPENILLGAHGHAYVADFGVALAASAAGRERQTHAGTLLGSPLYTSPEQARGASGVDQRADLYSLGCVLHEMLAGTPPFSAAGAQAVIFRHQTEAPPPLRTLRPEVPPGIEAAVLTALEKDPERRFASAEELAAALASPERVPPARPGRRRRLPRLSLRHLLAAATLAGAGALAMAFVPPPVPPGRVGVMVLPIEAGAPPRAVRLDPALAAKLGMLPGLWSIDPRRVVDGEGRWRGLALEDLVRRSGNRGARYLVVSDADLMRVDGYAVNGARQIYTGTADPKRPIAEEMDRIGLELGQAIVEAEQIDLGGVRDVLAGTASLEALVELLRGQEHFAAADAEKALGPLRRAVARDSSFGAAYYRLSVAQGWAPIFDYPASLATAEAGLRRRGAMPPRWAELLAAQRHYVRRSADSAQFQFQKVLGENPRMPDALLGAGETAYHSGGMLGERPATARPLFEALLQIDSTFAPIQSHLVAIALYEDDEALARRYLPRVDPSRRPVSEAAVALGFGSGRRRAHTLVSLRGAARGDLSNLISLFVQEALDLAVADSLAAILTDTARNLDDRVRGGQFRLAILAAQGRYAEGMRAWEAAAGPRVFDAWVVHAYLAGYPAEARARPMLAWAQEQLAAGRIPDFAPLQRGDSRKIELYDGFRALVHQAVLWGDSARVHDLVRRIDAAAGKADPSDPGPEAYRAALRARLALLARDTTTTIAELERAVARAPWEASLNLPLADAAPERLLLARLRAARGDTAGARRMLDSFGRVWCVGDALYFEAAARLRFELRGVRSAPGVSARVARPAGPGG